MNLKEDNIDADELRSHLDDFTTTTGDRPGCFVCPITMAMCSPQHLINGHVINKAIPRSSPQTVIQFGHVDGFYGTRIEHSFVNFLKFVHATPSERLKASSELTVRFADGSTEQAFRVQTPKKIAAASKKFKLMPVWHEGEYVTDVFVRVEKDDPRLKEKSVEIGVEESFYPSHFNVAMLKMAFLALFKLQGYRGVWTRYGDFVRTPLANFYLQNMPRTAAAKHFHAFRNCTKVLMDSNGIDLPLTLNDRSVLLHFTPGNFLFAMSLSFKLQDTVASVAIPFNASADQAVYDQTIAIYEEFIANNGNVPQFGRWMKIGEDRHFYPLSDRVRIHYPPESDKVFAACQ